MKDGGVVPSYFSQLSNRLPGLANILLLYVLQSQQEQVTTGLLGPHKATLEGYFSICLCFTCKHGFLN